MRAFAAASRRTAAPARGSVRSSARSARIVAARSSISCSWPYLPCPLPLWFGRRSGSRLGDTTYPRSGVRQALIRVDGARFEVVGIERRDGLRSNQNHQLGLRFVYVLALEQRAQDWNIS